MSKRAEGAERRHRSVGGLLLSIVLAAVVLTVATTAYGYALSIRRARSDAASDARFQADLAADAIEDSIDEAVTGMAGSVASPGLVQALTRPEGCSLTSGGAGVFPDGHIDIVRPDGTVTCSSLARTGAPPDATHGDAPWIAEALQGDGPQVFPVTDDALTGEPSVVVAAPLLDGTEPVGVLAYLLGVSDVAPRLARTYGGPTGFVFTVVEPATEVVRSASSEPDSAGRGLEGTGFAGRPDGTWSGLDGTRRIYASGPVPTLGWRIYAGLDEDTATASARDLLARGIALASFAVIALATMAAVVARRIVAPLRAMTRAVLAAGRSPLPTPIPVAGPAEISLLARQFNEMLDARVDYESQLTAQASYDLLTGLANRGLVRDRVDRALRRVGDASAGVAVLFVDLDRFGVVNDGLGHATGDALLRAVAVRLEEAVTPGETVGRFGGDQFVVVCDDVDTVGAVAVARSLAAALETPFPVADTEVTLTASVGIALASGPDHDPDDMVREAAIAMAEAKANRRGWELFDEDLRASTDSRLAIEQALRHALARDQLELHYQPIFDITGDEPRLASVEALARWTHPELGSVSPAQFIPVAEATGQMATIGAFVLDQACAHVSDLNREGADLTVAVNISVHQLDDSLPVVVASALERSGLEARHLRLEITETAMVRLLGPGLDTLARLRALGVDLAIDDFGTGYSSLSYLQHLDVDELKIDRSFVELLGRDDRTRALVRTIISIALALDLCVVAEGVETEEQLEELRRLGCTHVQGYLLARPLPVGALDALVAETVST
ncbi:MAG TPA: EAL domain-containing protein [Iamia sp.]|nr:EAL domain-containing protein [Iamia sp.]